MSGRWLLWLVLMSLSAVLALAFAGTGVPTALKTPGVEALVPLENLLQGLTGGLNTVLDAASRAGSLEEENQELRREIQRLQSEVLRLQETGKENLQLRALLNYARDNPGREYLSASIIAYDPSNFIRSVVINRGSDHGVQKGMVVVADLGLVGKVVEAHPRAAKVLLVTDPSSVVNALVQRSRVQGVVSGASDQGITMRYVAKDADIKVGDVVVTSGLGGGFPKGIPLGKVAQVTAKDQALYKEVRLQPAARVAALEVVLILTDFTPIELP